MRPFLTVSTLLVNLIGEARDLVVSPDQESIHITDSATAKVLKLEQD